MVECGLTAALGSLAAGRSGENLAVYCSLLDATNLNRAAMLGEREEEKNFLLFLLAVESSPIRLR